MPYLDNLNLKSDNNIHFSSWARVDLCADRHTTKSSSIQSLLLIALNVLQISVVFWRTHYFSPCFFLLGLLDIFSKFCTTSIFIIADWLKTFHTELVAVIPSTTTTTLSNIRPTGMYYGYYKTEYFYQFRGLPKFLFLLGRYCQGDTFVTK
jgi:hypothetical protein